MKRCKSYYVAIALLVNTLTTLFIYCFRTDGQDSNCCTDGNFLIPRVMHVLYSCSFVQEENDALSQLFSQSFEEEILNHQTSDQDQSTKNRTMSQQSNHNGFYQLRNKSFFGSSSGGMAHEQHHRRSNAIWYSRKLKIGGREQSTQHHRITEHITACWLETIQE